MVKQYKITFSGKDLERLELICQQLDLSKSEVICYGLKFMTLYAKSQTEKDARLILERDGNQKEIII